jgi:ribosomal protein S12 methylthiotransferase accessory factor
MILRVRRGIRIFHSGPNRIYWRDDSRSGIFSAPFAGKLVEILKIPRPAEGILRRFDASDREAASQTLDGMIGEAIIQEASVPSDSARSRRSRDLRPQYGRREKLNLGVTVRGKSEKLVITLSRELEQIGFTLSLDGSLVIFVAPSYLDPELGREQRIAEHAGKRWLPVMLGAEQVWLGPVVRPGATPCWQCFESRLAERDWLVSQLPADGWQTTEAEWDDSPTDEAAVMAAREIARWLYEAPPSLEGVLWTFDLDLDRGLPHTVLPAENCPVCPAPARPLPQFSERPAAHSDNLREPITISFQATLEKLASPITGIVSELQQVDFVDDPPVFLYGARCNVTLPPLQKRMLGGILRPAICSGRGWTPEVARLACVAEVAERYCGQFSGHERTYRATYRELHQEAIHPNSIQLFSPDQFKSRLRRNGVNSPDPSIPEPLDENEPLEWVEGRSLNDGRRLLLPLALCYRNFRPPNQRWIGDADSNGCAAGVSHVEAALHALLELVERDARAIWWYNQIPSPAIELESVRDPRSLQIVSCLAAAGWEVTLHDITTDIGIPVITATGRSAAGWIRGSAANPSTLLAARSALAELWQLSRTPPRTYPLPESGEPELELENRGTPVLNQPIDSILRDCCDKVRLVGCDAIVFDLTRRGIEVPVVRVVSPGLRHKKPRFAQGRLFDVPVRMGWRKEPAIESIFPAVEP